MNRKSAKKSSVFQIKRNTAKKSAKKSSPNKLIFFLKLRKLSIFFCYQSSVLLHWASKVLNCVSVLLHCAFALCRLTLPLLCATELWLKSSFVFCCCTLPSEFLGTPRTFQNLSKHLKGRSKLCFRT